MSRAALVYGFVLKGGARGWYVAPPGLPHSYTRELGKARVFETREAAERERCGNEAVIELGGALVVVREPGAALAAYRSYWWGRDPAQAWTYTSFVVPPRDYTRALERLADWWAGRYPFALSPDVVAFTSL